MPGKAERITVNGFTPAMENIRLEPSGILLREGITIKIHV